MGLSCLATLLLCFLIGTAQATGPVIIAPNSVTPGHLDGTPVNPVTFSVIGDYGFGCCSGAKATARMVKTWNPAFIITTGDNNYGGTAVGDPGWSLNIGSLYGSFIQRRADNRYPEQTSTTNRFFASVGNHDTGSTPSFGGGLDGFIDYLHDNPGATPRMPVGSGIVNTTTCYYDFIIGTAHFFVIDGQGLINPASLAAQRAWALQAVQNSTARWKFLVMHPPPYTSTVNAGFQGFRWHDVWSAGVSALFVGHTHNYERLNLSTVHPSLAGSELRQFTVGISGATLNGLPLPRASNTEMAYNSNYGALRVTVDEFAARFEMLSIDDGAAGANGGVLRDSLVLGTPRPLTHDFDEYMFYAEVGQHIHIHTATPAPPPPDTNTLAPRLTLTTPNGTVITNTGGAPDGINALLETTALVDGYFKIVINTPASTIGPYALHNQVTDPPYEPIDPPNNGPRPSYGVWLASYPGGPPGGLPTDDPDQDGLQHGVEYFLNSHPYEKHDGTVPPTLTVNRFGSARFSFDLPLPTPSSTQCLIERSCDIAHGTWEVISTKNGTQPWTGPSSVIEIPLPGGIARVVVRDLPSQPLRDRCFYRMRIILQP